MSPQFGGGSNFKKIGWWFIWRYGLSVLRVPFTRWHEFFQKVKNLYNLSGSESIVV
jgi:hypothetical protein